MVIDQTTWFFRGWPISTGLAGGAFRRPWSRKIFGHNGVNHCATLIIQKKKKRKKLCLLKSVCWLYNKRRASYSIYIKGHLSAELFILFLNGYCRSGLINTSVIVPGPPSTATEKEQVERGNRRKIPTISSGFLCCKEGNIYPPPSHHWWLFALCIIYTAQGLLLLLDRRAEEMHTNERLFISSKILYIYIYRRQHQQ